MANRIISWETNDNETNLNFEVGNADQLSFAALSAAIVWAEHQRFIPAGSLLTISQKALEIAETFQNTGEFHNILKPVLEN